MDPGDSGDKKGEHETRDADDFSEDAKNQNGWCSLFLVRSIASRVPITVPRARVLGLLA
ncbi:hypothetical protein [Rhodococcus koreensis]|uniref:hypothetical protein n=1 Tax=Rhodococcus koreensis TaxID=99653 RepID=UPI0036718BDF